jgi:hypothetical protein
MSRSNKLSRLAALEERASATWPPQAEEVDENATAAFKWLLDLYREKQPQLVAAIEAAAQHKGASSDLRRAFAMKVVDLLALIDRNHRDEFFQRSRGLYPPGADTEKASTLPDEVLLDSVVHGIGEITPPEG